MDNVKLKHIIVSFEHFDLHSFFLSNISFNCIRFMLIFASTNPICYYQYALCIADVSQDRQHGFGVLFCCCCTFTGLNSLPKWCTTIDNCQVCHSMIVLPEPRLWYILPGCLLDLSNGISEGIVLNYYYGTLSQSFPNKLSAH